MEKNDNRKWLYEQLKGQYGDDNHYEEFCSYLDDDENVEELYNTLGDSKESKYGDLDTFKKAIGKKNDQQSNPAETTGSIPSEKPMNEQDYIDAAMTFGNMRRAGQQYFDAVNKNIEQKKGSVGKDIVDNLGLSEDKKRALAESEADEIRALNEYYENYDIDNRPVLEGEGMLAEGDQYASDESQALYFTAVNNGKEPADNRQKDVVDNMKKMVADAMLVNSNGKLVLTDAGARYVNRRKQADKYNDKALEDALQLVAPVVKKAFENVYSKKEAENSANNYGSMVYGGREGKMMIKSDMKAVESKNETFDNYAAALSEEFTKMLNDKDVASKLVDIAKDYTINGKKASAQEFIDNLLYPVLSKRVEEALKDKHAPSGAAGYIIANLLQNTIVGKVLSGNIAAGEGYNSVVNAGLDKSGKNQGWFTKAFSEGLNIAADFWTFGVTGKLGQATAKVALLPQATKYMSAGMKFGDAMSTAGRVAQGTRLGAMAEIASEAASMGYYEMLNEGVNQLANGEFDGERLLGVGLKGSIMGVMLCGTRMFNKRAWGDVTGTTMKDYAKVGGRYATSLAARTAVMTGTSLVDMYLQNPDEFDISAVDLQEMLMHNMWVNAGFDVHGLYKTFKAVGTANPKALVKATNPQDWQKVNTEFDEQCKKECKAAGLQGDTLDDIVKMMLYETRGMNPDKASSHVYKALSSGELSDHTRSLLMYYITGQRRAVAPVYSAKAVEGNDGKILVELYALNGQTVRRAAFDNETDAAKFMDEQKADGVRQNVMLAETTLDSADSANAFIYLARREAEMLGIDKNQAMDIYNRGINGETLQGAELALYNHMVEVAEMNRSNEEFSVEKVRNDVEDSMNLKAGTIQKLLEKDPRKLTQDEKTIYVEYTNQLLDTMKNASGDGSGKMLYNGMQYNYGGRKYIITGSGYNRADAEGMVYMLDPTTNEIFTLRGGDITMRMDADRRAVEEAELKESGATGTEGVLESRMNTSRDAAVDAMKGAMDANTIDETVNGLGRTPYERIDAIIKDRELSEDQKNALVDFVLAKYNYEYENGKKLQSRAGRKEAAEESVDKITLNGTDKVVKVKALGEEGYVVVGDYFGGIDKAIIVVTKDGKRISTTRNNVEELSVTNAADEKQAAINAMDMYELSKLHHVKIVTGADMELSAGSAVYVKGNDNEGKIVKVSKSKEGLLESYDVEFTGKDGNVSKQTIAAKDVFTKDSVDLFNDAHARFNALAAEMAKDESARKKDNAANTEQEPVEDVKPVEMKRNEEGKIDYEASGADATFEYYMQQGKPKEAVLGNARKKKEVADERLNEAIKAESDVLSKKPNVDEYDELEDYDVAEAEWKKEMKAASDAVSQAKESSMFWDSVIRRLEESYGNRSASGRAVLEMLRGTGVNESTEAVNYGINLMEGESIEGASRRLKVGLDKLKALDRIAKALKVKISFTDRLGTSVGTEANAENDAANRVIRISLERMRAGEEMAFVTGHELTHQIKADSQELMENYIEMLKQAVGEREWNRRYKEMEDSYAEIFAKEANEKGLEGEEAAKYIEDGINEELAADITGGMFARGDMIKEIANHIEHSKSVQEMHALKRYALRLKDMAKKVRDYFRDNKQTSDQIALGHLLESIDRVMAKIDTEDAMSKIAPNKFSTSATMRGAGFDSYDTDDSGNITPMTDEEGNVVMKLGEKVFSTRNHVTVEDVKSAENSALNYMMNDALKLGSISEERAEVVYKKYADILNMYLEMGSARNGGSLGIQDTWQWLGETVFRTVATNGDKQYSFSLDITRVCKKNEAVINCISELQRRVGYGITPAQIMDIYNETNAQDYQVPCPVCYVFSRYIRNGKYATAAINGMLKYGKHLKGQPEEWNVEQWLAEKARLEEQNERNKEVISKATNDVTVILQEVDKLGDIIQSNKSSKAEKEAAKKKISELDSRYRAALNVISQQSMTNWIKSFAIHSVKNKWVLWNDTTMPSDIEDFKNNALDLRLTANTMQNYPAIQRLRKSGGAAAGKEITYASNNEIGELSMSLGTGDPVKAKNFYQIAVEARTEKQRSSALKKARKRFAEAMDYAQKQSLRGGQRMWSWSDNIERLSPDVAINLMQMEILGGALQSYSKQLEGINMVARMGGYVNGSLMGKGIGYREVESGDVEVIGGKRYLKNGSFVTDEGVEILTPVYTEDGKDYVLEFDDVVGIDPFGKTGEDGKHRKGLFELNNMLDKAGNIIVGMNDIHVKASMHDNRIYFIIPWHASGQSNHILRQMLSSLGVNLKDFNPVDYTDMQEEKDYGKLVDGKTQDVPERLVELWENHKNETDWECGIEGGIKSGDGGKLSAGQIHYRELRDAIFDGTADQNAAFMEEINNDAFLRQVYMKVKTTVRSGKMTNADKGFIYPYEYWDMNSTFDTADVNGARYLEYARRLGYKPKFSGRWKRGNPNEGNFIDCDGFWKLLIDRRMYDTNGKFQDLTAIDSSGFSPDLVDPVKNGEEFVVTRVADDEGVSRIADAVYELETKRTGTIPKVDYALNMDTASDAYTDVTIRGKKYSVPKRKSYGAPYTGSKNRVVRDLFEVLPDGKRFVDLFSGGGAMTHGAMLSGKYNSYRMNDLRPVGQQLFLDGIDGKYEGYNGEHDKESFKGIKGTPESLLWSYGANGRSYMGDDNSRVASRVSRVNSLQELKPMRDQIEASAVDYRDVDIQDGDVLYADIPYEGTDNSAYGNAGKFNWNGFSRWASGLDVPVYVSSQNAPEGFTEIWSKEIGGFKAGQTKTERLFVQDKFAEAEKERIANVELKYNGRYSVSSTSKQKQFDIIQNANSMTDDYHTGIRSVEDIKTFEEAMSDFAGAPDWKENDMRKAMESGRVKVYSSKPIENGVFVTPSRMMAKDYAGGGKVYEQDVKTSDVAWIDSTEGQIAKFSVKRNEGESLIDYAQRVDEENKMEPLRREHEEMSREQGGVKYSIVRDEKKIAELDSSELIPVYRTMLTDDNGNLLTPMSSEGIGKTKDGSDGKRRAGSKKDTVDNTTGMLYSWEQADEHPEIATLNDGDEYAHVTIYDDAGGATPVAYNPYIHTSFQMLNDQFAKAWRRPNMVVVKCLVPKSELESGYKADMAKDAVGSMKWTDGVVSRTFKKVPRRVMLTRWAKPVEIVRMEKYAKSVKKLLEKNGVLEAGIPFSNVTPSQREALAAVGVPIVEPKGNGKNAASMKAYNEWKSDRSKKYSVTKSNKFKKWFGDWEKDADDYITIRPEQIKSADIVTYDKNGKVIPLSNRFDKNNTDIRYSVGRRRANREFAGDADAEMILNDFEARDIEEVASQVIAGSKLMWKSEGDGEYRLKGVADELGWGEGERRKFLQITSTRANGGKTLIEIGEMVEQACRDQHVRYDESDANAGINAAIEVLRQSKSSGEVSKFIENNRIEEARRIHEQNIERESEYEEQYNADRDMAYMERYGIPYAEYVESLASMSEDEAERMRQIGSLDFTEHGVEKRQKPTNRKGENVGIDDDVIGADPMPVKPVKKSGETILEYGKRMAEYNDKKKAWEKRHLKEMTSREDAMKLLEEVIDAELGKEHYREIDRRALKGILKTMREVSPEKFLALRDEALRHVRRIEAKAIEREVTDLLNMKVKGLTGTRVEIGKKVDPDTQEIIENLRKSEREMETSGLENDIHKLYVDIWNMRQKAVEEFRELSYEEQLEISDKYTEIRELKEQARKITAKSVYYESTDGIAKQIDELNTKFYESIEGKVKWTKDDDNLLATLTAMKQLIEAKTKLRDAYDAESKLSAIETELGELWKQENSSLGNGLSEDEHNRQRKLRNEANGLRSLVNEARAEYIEEMTGFRDMLIDMIDGGKDNLRATLDKEKNRRIDIVKGCIHDITGSGSKKYDEQKSDEQTKTPWLKRPFTAPLSSFEYMAQLIATRTLGKDSYFYKRFITGDEGVIAANNVYITGVQNAVNRLNEMSKEIFGKDYSEMMEDQRTFNSGIEYFPEGSEYPEMLKCTKGQAMYIYMLWKMKDGQAKLRVQGFDENSIEQVKSFIGDKYIRFADWVQGTFLEEQRERYNSRYKEIYHTNMAKIENYVPIKISKGSIRQQEDMTGDVGGNGAISVKTGGLVKRTTNVNPIDLNQSAFNVIFGHINEMEEFYAFAPVRRDLSYVMSNRFFRNQLNANRAGQFQRLLDASKIAVHARPDESADQMGSILSTIQKGLVGGNIAFRNTTALKQMLSVPAYIGYSQDPRFLAALGKNILGQYGRNLPAMLYTMGTEGFGGDLLKKADKGSEIVRKVLSDNILWCMKNVPDFNERILKGTSGDNRMDEKSSRKFVDEYFKVGMRANQMVDAITCSIGIKTIYDYKMARFEANAKNEGLEGAEYDKAKLEAHRQAIMDATVYYNSTQQSGHVAFLSPMQVSRGFISRGFSLYKNSPISYARKLAESIEDLKRLHSSKGKRELLRELVSQYEKEEIARMMEEDDTLSEVGAMNEIDYDELRKRARKYLNNEARKRVVDAVLYGFVMNHVWNIGGKGLLGFFLGNGLAKALMGADPEDDDVKASDILSYWATVPMNGVAGYDIVNQVVNGIRSGKGQGLGNNLIGQEIVSMFSEVGKTWDDYGLSPESMYTTLKYPSKIATGVNPEVWGNVALGYCDMIANGYSDADRRVIDLMYILNSPNSNRAMVAKNLFADRSIEEFVDACRFAMRYRKDMEGEPTWGARRTVTSIIGTRDWSDKKKKELMALWNEAHLTDKEKKRAEEWAELMESLDGCETVEELKEYYDNVKDDMARKKCESKLKKAIEEQSAVNDISMEEEAKEDWNKKNGVPDEKQQAKFDSTEGKDMYDNMKDANDVDEDIKLNEKYMEYSDIYHEWESLNGSVKNEFYANHDDEIKTYRMLSKARGNISKEKRSMNAENAEEMMVKIREERRKVLGE